jgi:hypothetical protein
MKLVYDWTSDGDEPRRRPLRFYSLWIAVALALSTAALCSYDRFALSGLDPAAARAAIANGSAERGAVTILLRETRANIDALRQLAAEPHSDRGEQAKLALEQIREKAR